MLPAIILYTGTIGARCLRHNTGSNIHGGTGVQITADIGDVQILSAANTTETFSFEESKTVGLGDMVEGLSSGEGPVQNQDGRLTVKIADATYDRVETQTNATDMIGSSITSGGNEIGRASCRERV